MKVRAALVSQKRNEIEIWACNGDTSRRARTKWAGKSKDCMGITRAFQISLWDSEVESLI